MSNFTDLTVAESSWGDNSLRGDINRVALGELYDSNVNAFNFNELILNDVVLIKNTNVGLVDNTGSSDAFSDEVGALNGTFTRKTNSSTSWTDLT